MLNKGRNVLSHADVELLQDLAKFIEDLRTGAVKPYMKSMPVPKKQDTVVRKVVAHNYDEEIHKVKKDAVLFFYAPW